MKTLILIVLLQVILIAPNLTLAEPPRQEQGFTRCLFDYKPSNPSFPIQKFMYTQSSPSFLTTLNNYVRNLRFFNSTSHKPIVIVAAAHESHVQATVTCAKKLGLHLRIRSGGHDYDALSYTSAEEFVLLDMFNLRSIQIDPTVDTAWIESGATLGELYYAISNKSNVRAFPAGLCPGLGVGGHFSGGGYGTLLRKFGLASDNIIDAKIVDVNGRILDRKSMGEDLFWALRGGGAASFCVVLSWQIQLVPVPEKVTVFQVERSVEDGATDLFVRWQEVADDIDDELFIRLTLSVGNATKGPGKTVKGSFMGVFLGSSEKLLEVMNTKFPELGLNQTDCTEMTWIESVLFSYSLPKGTPTTVLLQRIPKKLIYLKRKSDYVQETIQKPDLESIFKIMLENEAVSMAWNPYGGKMSEILATDTPFPHRSGNKFKIQYAANWFSQGNDGGSLYLSQTEKVFEAMTPYVSKNPREAFLNYRDVDIGTSKNSTYEEGKVYGLKYFKDNFERLVMVKTRVDPDNFFRYEQSIPVHSG